MGVRAYYNEIDPYCCAWLRNLIKAGLIAPGDVDERDIREVQPEDLKGYTQLHWFAGVGVWSYALRLAGWPDDRRVWTGSCPCQSFSVAGKQKGFKDERHLWPDWFRLIRECRPDTLFGEQVASPAALQWLDLVSDDLEAEGYAIGAFDLPACSVGAPHIRQRLWFVANTGRVRRVHAAGCGGDVGAAGGAAGAVWAERVRDEPRPDDGGLCAVADTHRSGQPAGGGAVWPQGGHDTGRGSPDGELAHSCSDERGAGRSGGADGDGAEQPAGRSDDGLLADTAGERRDGPAGMSQPGGRGIAEAGRFMGDTSGAGLARRPGERGDDGSQQPPAERAGGAVGELAYATSVRQQRLHALAGSDDEGDGGAGDRGSQRGASFQSERSSADSGLGDAGDAECDGRSASGAGPEGLQHAPEPGPLGGFWRDAYWIYCRDEKWRPVESVPVALADGSAPWLGRVCTSPDGQAYVHPLTVGAPSRVGRLKGYGNSINAELAAEFVRAYRDICGE